MGGHLACLIPVLRLPDLLPWLTTWQSPLVRIISVTIWIWYFIFNAWQCKRTYAHWYSITEKDMINIQVNYYAMLPVLLTKLLSSGFRDKWNYFLSFCCLFVCLYETENTTCPSFCKYIVSLENLSPNQTAFFLTGAAGSSCQAQKAFSNWSLLPHLWPGDLHVRTGVGLYLRLSLLLYTSGQFSFSLLFSCITSWTQWHGVLINK